VSENVGEAYIEVHADDSRLTAEVKAAAERAAKAAKARVEYEASVDAKKVAAEAKAAADRAARSARVKFEGDADFADIIAEARAAAAAAKTRIEVEMVLNKRGFTRDASGVFRGLRGEALTAEQAVSQVAESLGEIKAPKGVGLVDSGLESLAGAAARGGAGIALVVAAVQALLPYAIAVGGGIVALAGQLAYASAQAIPLATNLGAIALGAVATIVATRGLGDAFKAYAKYQEVANSADKKTKAGRDAIAKANDAYKASLDDLPASAQKFVTSIGELGGAFRGLRRDVQDEFFKGLGDQIRDTSDRLLPVLRTGLVQTAGLIGDGAEQLLKWAGSKKGIEQISNILSGLNGILKPLISAAGSFGGGLLTIFEGALPAGKDLATAIQDIGDRFQEWAGKFVDSGGLTELLDNAKEAGGRLLDILDNVGSILGSLFDGSKDLGGDLLDSLDTITGKFADFLDTDEGQQAMADFFKDVGDNLGGIADGLRDAAPAIKDLGKNLQQGADGFNRLADAIAPISEPLGTVIGLLGAGGFPALVGGIGAVTGALQGMDEVDFNGIVQSLTGLPGLIASAFDTPIDFTGLARSVNDGINDALAAAVDIPGVQAILGPVGSAIITGLVAGFDAAVDQVQGWLQDLTNLIPDWKGPASTDASLLTPAGTAIILSLIPGFEAGRGGVMGWLTAFTSTLAGPFAGLAGRLFANAGSLAGAFAAWAAGLPGQAAGIAGSIASSFVGLASRMLSQAGSIASAIGAWLSPAPGTVRGYVQGMIAPWSGLAGRMISQAGSILAAAGRWLAGVQGAARSAAERMVAAFRGLASRIVDAIGTIIPRIGMPNISGIVSRIKSAVQSAAEPAAVGDIVTSPQFRLVGEAGPEAIVPLSPGAKMDPEVVSLLRGVAAMNGMGVEGTAAAPAGPGLHVTQHITVPTEDPEAAAMAILNRLALALAA